MVLSQVRGFSENVIVDLSPLSTLDSVGGSLSALDNNALKKNLAGLGYITSLGGDLLVMSNPVLNNLNGLSSLISVDGTLGVKDNATLTNFCGLYPLLSSNGLVGGYEVTGNLVNPTTQQIIDDGPCTTTALAQNDLLPTDYNLNQNYPNPFNPSTTIRYGLSEQSTIRLTVFDIQGREIMTLQDGSKPAGNYHIMWDGLDHWGNPVSAGVYFARLQTGEYNRTIKMVYLR